MALSMNNENRDGQDGCVAVLVPAPLSGLLDYRVPPDLSVEVGDYVAVPLGARRLTGVVWGPATGEVARSRLRNIEARLDHPPFPAISRRFIDWVARYAMAPPGAILKMALPEPDALRPPKPVETVRRTDPPPGARSTAMRDKVLASLLPGTAMTPSDLARAAGVSAGVVRGMIAAGWLESRSEPVALPAIPDRTPTFLPPDLSADQAAAAAELTDLVNGGFATALIDGVTGSGKTEVYFAALAEVAGRGRQVLVLVPEIILTAQWLDRFRTRFGADPLVWHSGLGRARRIAAFREIALGRAQVVIGARSALFLPFPDLGLIVVDEEHEPAFKQEDGVLYHARDMAVVRGMLGDHPVLLASATPSLETLVNAEAGRYRHVRLTERYAGAALPEVRIADLRADLPAAGPWGEGFIGGPLAREIYVNLDAQQQTLLFLNRRGYAPLTVCRSCGFRLECPHCSAWLVEHRQGPLKGRLQCHHCGYAAPPPESCPSCGATDALTAVGPGVERLAEEVAGRFPGARLAVVTSDTVSSPRQALATMKMIADGGADILIGTQMLAKGHHFPDLTLAGVIDADLGLAGGDPRAAERTFQLVTQVAGRAGRGARPGRAILQTRAPEHPVIAAIATGERDRFMAIEREAREMFGYPPFGRLAALIVAAPDRDLAQGAADTLARAAPLAREVEVLGPAPAPMFLLRGRFRHRFLLKTPRRTDIQAVMSAWLSRVRLDRRVKLTVDIDPYSFF